MEDKSIVIDGFTVQYGKTTVQELVNRGYSISDFEQSMEEPVLVCCSLYKDNELVASIWFYDITNKISPEQLYDMPIDLVLLEEGLRRKEEPPQRKYKQQKLGVGHRIFLSCLFHVALAAFFAYMFSDPARYEWFNSQTSRLTGNPLPIVLMFLVLPAALIASFWNGDIIGKKGNLSKKILISLGFILNVGISLAYTLLIWNHFWHTLF